MKLPLRHISLPHRSSQRLRRWVPLALMIVTLAACGSSAQDARGGSSTSTGPSLVTLDGSSTVFPISEAVAEEFQKAEKGVNVTVGISGTGGGFQKFCRGEIDISDASRPISASESRGLQEGRRRVHRAAGRLRRHRDRREPEGHVGRHDHGRRAEEAVGAGRAGQGHQVEPGPQRLARPRDSPVRRRRRLRHLRLLHRGHQRQGQGQPRRLHVERRRQRARPGHQQRRARARLLPLRLLRREQGQAEARAGGRRQGRQRRRADRRRAPRRFEPAPTSRCRGRSSSTCRRRPPSVPRCRSSSSST